jgi:hypothetical protein
MNFKFDTDTENVTNENLFERIRVWRDAELRNSDWTQLSDAVCDKDAWVTYRQALRDLPNQSDNPTDLIFPTKPE